MQPIDFTAEWKSLFPISAASSPLLISNQNPQIGPLFFSPNSTTPPTLLLHNHSLSPLLPPPNPNLSFSQFLQNHDSTPSSATSITDQLGSQLPDYSAHFHAFNSLQLLRIPNQNSFVAFFPAGENSDKVGFCVVQSGKECRLQVPKQGCSSNCRISRLLVNPFDDFSFDFDDDDDVDSSTVNNISIIGFVMVCTEYSVSWYKVGVDGGTSVSLDYVGCVDSKRLKGSSVVSACWSPHLREECLVLLKNGSLLLFDVNKSPERKGGLMSLVRQTNCSKYVDRSIHVSLNDEVGLQGEDGGWWIGCDFCWHPRIFFVSRSNAVFMVDVRLDSKYEIVCLLKLEKFSILKNDAFLALSRSGSDGFNFAVSTRRLLLLCDVRRPMMPVLRWEHEIENPRYMTVFRLSDLRANAGDDKFRWASESGYGILVGSFWDGHFTLFCYGTPGSCKDDKSVSSEILKFCNSQIAWGLPSAFLLSDCDCNCGSCLLRKEFSKTVFPDWIDWRQKKQFVLGFGILDADISMLMSKPKSSGGFVLIRLMSSGKLEALQYNAEWECEKNSELGHKRKSNFLEDSRLYDRHDSEYDGKKVFQHFSFDYLNAYLSNNLAGYVASRIEKTVQSGEDSRKKAKVDFHDEICRKLKDLGFPKRKSSSTVSDVLNDISLPTSIHEVALRSMWSALPTSLLQLGFSTYSDFEDELQRMEHHEFLDIPEQLQLPPFLSRKPSCRSNKWSNKVQPFDTLIGPVLPPHFLMALHNLRRKELIEKEPSKEEESPTCFNFEQKCDEVTEVVNERVSCCDAKTHDDDFVSLADDTDNISQCSQNVKLNYHKPLAFSENSTTKKSGFENGKFSTHVFRKSQEVASDLSEDIVGPKLFDVGCPIELKFDNDLDVSFGVKELELFRSLKKRELNFQKRFKPYQDYINGANKLE